MKISRPREGWPRFLWGTVVMPLAIMSSGFIAGWVFPPSISFWGDASAAGARVYVDGALVGQLPGAADSLVAGGAVYRSAYGSLAHPFRPGRHSVVFVSRLGDSLGGEFRTRDASSVSVSFFTKKIQGVDPLRR